MTDVVIIGSIAVDSIETPFKKRENVLGGSATYAAFAASFFCKPGIVAVVGGDFPQEHINLLKSKGISIEGLKTEKDGKTFHWEGSYKIDMNEAKTLKTELNVLEIFKPQLPQEYRKAKYVFLGNINPELQIDVLAQIDAPKFVVADTMNFYIQHKKKELEKVISKIDLFLLNDGEARQLFETKNLIKAGKQALKLGTKAVIIKKGEHGALLFSSQGHFSAPSYPLEDIVDPTGCGDSFGGGLIGYLAKTGDLSDSNLRRAIIYGSVIASHNAQDFGPDNLSKISLSDIEKRYLELRQMREF
jgi:sugar/nucleoside kinase (ribokinase family)